MALSGSTDFSMTAVDLLKASMRACRVLQSGGTLTAAETTDGLEALNIVLKALMPHGLKLWLRKEQAITLTASKATYTLGPSGADVTMDRPVEIVSAYRRDSSNYDVTMTKMSRDEYLTLTDKAAEGTPINYYFDPQRTTAQITFWNVPDTTAASEYTVRIHYRKPIDDLDASTDDIEIPVEWYRALKWQLAKELLTEFDVPPVTAQRISKMAETTLDRAMEADFEEGVDVMLQPDYEGRE